MASPRPLRITPALVALTALALLPLTAPVALAQTTPVKAKAETAPEMLEAAEKLFAEGKYQDARLKYKQVQDKFGARMDEDMLGAVSIRIASCEYLAKRWPEAEAALKEFLEKYPNGSGVVLDPANNFRGSAVISLASTLANQGKFDDALAGLSNFEINPLNSEQDRIKARTFRAEVLELRVAKTGTPEEKKAATIRAAELLKQIMQGASMSVPEVKEAGYKLVQLYTKLGKIAEATQLRMELEKTITNPMELVRSNFLKMDLGDKYFQQAEELQASGDEGDVRKRETLYKSAIDAYQGVHRRAYIAGFMDKAVAEAKNRLENAKLKHPETTAGQKPEPVARAESDFNALEQIQKDFEKNKSYDSLLAYRLGLCLTELKRPWESRIAFKEIIEKDASFEKADIAHYYYINALNDIRRYKDAQAECKKFLAQYPKSEVLGNIAVMLGEISAHQGEYQQAIDNYRWARTNVAALKPSDCEYIDSAIADAYFRNLEWKDARKAMEYFLSTYPRSGQREVMSYMRALTFFYEGNYKDTKANFDQYQRDFPTGEHVPDVRYRTGLVILGLKPDNDAEAKSNADKVIERCEKWLSDYENDESDKIISQRPEVMTLKADALQKVADLRTLSKEVKKDYGDRAVQAYIDAAMKVGDNKQALDFLLRELNKTLPARGEWDRLREIYRTLYERNKHSPDALGHLYWIIKCTEKLGKSPEERIKSSEEAKTILANAIVDNINDVRQDEVESLVIELAQKLAREVKKREKLNKDKPGSVEPFDAGAALESLLKLKENKDSRIAQARGIFAKAEIERALKHPQEAETELDKLAVRFQPDELSPTILAIVGDHLLAKGKSAQAAALYTYLKQTHRGSRFADFGFAGLAETLLQAKKYKEALAIVDDALENQIANSKEKDLQFLRARLLMETAQYKDAKAAFESIAKTKEWRGEATAGSMYYLGMIEERQGNFVEAVNLYNRCYLAWKKYEKYAVKAVYRSALLYADKLGQKDAAAKTLNNELFKNENAALVARYKNVPEWTDAEELLARIK